MNPAWVRQAQMFIADLQKRVKAIEAREAETAKRLADLEAKRGPGRPPKDRTE